MRKVGGGDGIYYHRVRTQIRGIRRVSIKYAYCADLARPNDVDLYIYICYIWFILYYFIIINGIYFFTYFYYLYSIYIHC